MKRWVPLLIFSFFLFIIPSQLTHAETLEEQMKNLIGPQKQYNTMLSPVYLRTNTNEESISPQSGELALAQTDYVLPGRGGLDLEFKRIYKSGISNVQEMNARYVNGAWIDYVQSDTKTSSFYEERYNLGIGMRFSFPSIEVRTNEDGTSHRFLHTDSGDIYRLKQTMSEGKAVLLPEGQTVRDVVVTETSEFSNGQSDGVSKYVMTGNDGKKTYFSDDGRILGIVDRYGNSIVFQHSTITYVIDGAVIQKKLITSITDTVGRVTTIEYKQDGQFKVGPITNPSYSSEERYKASQNPNNIDSGDLQGKFQVVLHLPNDKSIVYDKTAVAVSPSKQVTRTRLQRVIDADGLPKYHFWYEQPDLGFTFMNGTQYSAYNRYENLVQIDYVKTNRMTKYIYNSYTQRLSQGSMQYRKIFEKRELIKKGYDPTKPKFEDRFSADIKDKTTYQYTNEADGFGYNGYLGYDNDYLRNTYRYSTEISDYRGSKTKYTYDGLHQLIVTEKSGKEHKELIYTERDEMKLVKKQESQLYQTVNGQVSANPVKRIENFRYDEFGDLTNYTGPEAPRDDKGIPLNSEHTVIYTYAYDKFHLLTSKTWKQNNNKTSQIVYTVDNVGNVTKETKMNTDNAEHSVVTDYQYDSYGNMTRKTAHSGDQSFTTEYEYGIDANGTNVKGAYVTKEFSTLNGAVIAKKYGYDMKSGNRTNEIDANGKQTVYDYDILSRLVKIAKPEGVADTYIYEEKPFTNLVIQHRDPMQVLYRYEYDIKGYLVKASVFDHGKWVLLQAYDYDFLGNKLKETNSNGHSIRYEYDSNDQLVKKSSYQNDSMLKGSTTVDYLIGYDTSTPLLVTITDEEGYPSKFYYDHLNRLVKKEVTPDRVRYYTTTYAYDYTGNVLSETDPRSHTNEHTYDNLGRLIVKRDALGNETIYEYNALDKVSVQKEPGNKTTRLVYDALGRVAEKRVYSEGSPDHTYTRFNYDSVGNVVRLKQGTIIAGADLLSSDISYAYDAMNRISDEYRKMDGTRTGHIQYEYDKSGNKTRTIENADEAGKKYRLFVNSYDYAGKVIEEKGSYREIQADGTFVEYGKYQTVYERDYVGNVVKEQHLASSGYNTTNFIYDYLSQVTSKTEHYDGNPTGKRTRYTYDKTGRFLSETLTVQGVDVTVSQTLDGLGRTTTKIDPLWNMTRYVYDANGNRIKEIDPRYQAMPTDEAPGIEYTYDELNRLVLATAVDGQTREVIGYNKYDGRGNIVLEAGGEGYNPSQPEKSYGNFYTYDANDRKISFVSAQMMADNERSGTANVSSRLEYDGNGNIISETDALGRKTSYTYYLNGLLKEKTFPDRGLETYDYDLTGKALIVKQDRKGRVTRSFQTIFNKPYRIEYPDGTVERMNYSPKGELTERIDQAGHTQSFEYDSSGNPIRQLEFIEADSSYMTYKLMELRYDEANRLLSSETFEYLKPVKAGLEEKRRSAGNRMDNVYDKAGRLLRVTGPSGRETVQEYDATGNVVELRQKVSEGIEDATRFAYDFRSRKISETQLVKMADLINGELAEAKIDDKYVDRVQSTTTFGYDKNGNVTRQTDAKGHTSLFEYDHDNRLTKKIDSMQSEFVYGYDLKGNLIEEIDANGVSVRYEYDELNRLIRERKPAADGSVATARYVYDKSGNLIKQISPNQYDPSLDDASSVLEMIGTGYTYDAMDRRTSTISPDGKGMEYIQYDSRGKVVKVVDGLRFNGNLASSAGTTFVYDGLGRMTKKTDALDYSTTYEYNVLGNLMKTTDALNHATAYVYNGDGTLRRVTYADGGILAFTYDKLGRKTSETNQLGATTAYTYNAFGKVKTIKDPYGQTIEAKYDLAGNLVSSKDKRGSVTLFKYDGNRQLTEKRMPLDRDGSGNVVYAVETYAYDVNGNLIRESLSGSRDSSFLRETTYTYYDNYLLKTESDNSGAFTKKEYDKNGNLIKTERLRDTSVYDIEKFEYDNQDRMVKRIRLVDENVLDRDSLSAADSLRDEVYSGKINIVTSYAYDVLGNLTRETDPRGFAVSYTYDALNRSSKVFRKVNGIVVFVQYKYNEVGNIASERNERGMVSLYTYDDMNRVETVKDPVGHMFKYRYDLAGNKTSDINANNNSMTYEYDKLNRLVTVKDPYGIVVNRNVYDVNGNIVKKIDAKGYLSGTADTQRYGTVYTYDLAGRMITEVNPEMVANSQSVNHRYNAAWEKVSETNALGETYTYTYDNAGRLTQVTDPLDVSTTYGYDLSGNKLNMTDGKGKVTQYRYGDFGLLLGVVNAANKPVSYHYDLALNMSEMLDRNGNHTHYKYDSRNMLQEKKVTETGDLIAYTYDEKGNRASMVDESGTTQYTYDKNNRLMKIAKNGMTQISYTYDAIGNVKSVMDKTGFITAYTYDKSSRMETVTAAGKTTIYAYDENGNRKSISYEGGVQEIYKYDRVNRLLMLKNVKPGGSVLSEFTYVYDAADRQTSKTDSYGTTNYVYDAAGRIEKVEAPGKTTVYVYDKNGNRQSLQETYTSEQPSGYVDPNSKAEVKYLVKKSEYVYSAVGELLQLVERMGNVSGKEVLEKTVTYLYDGNGNEVRQQTSYLHPHTRDMRQVNGANPYGDEITGDISTLIEKVSNTFDGFNRLKKAERTKAGERNIVEYLYDGDDLRTSKTVRSSKDGYAVKVTNYLYDRQYVVLETNETNQVSVRYVHGVNYIARIDASNKLSYYLFNGHGDVVQTVSESGIVENQYDYDIFGSPTLTIEIYAASIRYAGEFYDAEVGLYYLRARYYDPYIGRFISEDTYEGNINDPLSLNRYTYANNDPIMYVDPTGHAAEKNATVALKTTVEDGYGGNITGWNNKDKIATIVIQGQEVRIKADGNDATIVNGRVIIKPDTLDRLYNDVSNKKKDEVKYIIDTSATRQEIKTQVSVVITKGPDARINGETRVIHSSKINNDYSPTKEMKKVIENIYKEGSFNPEHLAMAKTIVEFECRDNPECSPKNKKTRSDEIDILMYQDRYFNMLDMQNEMIKKSINRKDTSITDLFVQQMNYAVAYGVLSNWSNARSINSGELGTFINIGTIGSNDPTAAALSSSSASLPFGGGAGKSGLGKAPLTKPSSKSTVPEPPAPKPSTEVAGTGTKGMGNALVKDTGKIADNTANLRSWAENKGWVRQDTAGGVEQWGVRNADGKFSWRLKLKPEVSPREGLGAGSSKPRFDARLDDKGTPTSYINPFTGELGGTSIGTHIPLGK